MCHLCFDAAEELVGRRQVVEGDSLEARTAVDKVLLARNYSEVGSPALGLADKLLGKSL